MKRNEKKSLAIMAAIVIVLVSLFIISYKQEKAGEIKIERFLSTPTECSELQNNLSMISEVKLATVYKTKIVLENSRISPREYLDKHPDDIVVRTDVAGDGNTVTIILTNEDPEKLELK